nr:hypothetical protein CFP56_72529 [Quercus suber]
MRHEDGPRISTLVFMRPHVVSPRSDGTTSSVAISSSGFGGLESQANNDPNFRSSSPCGGDRDTHTREQGKLLLVEAELYADEGGHWSDSQCRADQYPDVEEPESIL